MSMEHRRDEIMSDNTISPGCLVHYNDQHIEVKKDFFDLCAYDEDDFYKKTTRTGKKKKDGPNQECMAKILYLLENLTNHKKYAWYIKYLQDKDKGVKLQNEPKDYKIDDLSIRMIATMLYGVHSPSTVHSSIEVLIEKGYIKQYQNSKTSRAIYVLNIPGLQAALDKQHKDQIQDEQDDDFIEFAKEFETIFSEDENRDTSESVPPVQVSATSRRKEKIPSVQASATSRTKEIPLSSDEQTF